MRILLLDSGRGFRGGQRQAALLALGLRRRGHGVVAMVPPGAPLADRLGAAGLDVIPCGQRSDLDLWAAASVRRTAARIRPDLLHAYDARAHAVARLAQLTGLSTPLVVTRSVTYPPRNGWKYRQGVRRYVAVSHAVRQALLAAQVPARSIDVVPAGIPTPTPNEPVADLRRLGIAPGLPICIALAALAPEKGMDVLLEAAARLHRAGVPAQWLVLGDGPLRQALAARAREIASPVWFAGYREDFGPILRAADVLVHPARSEGFPTALLDALARGIPVVAADVGGTRELLGPGLGTLVPSGDPEALATAVSQWLGDPARRHAVREDGPRAAARFSADRMVEGNVETYEMALGDERA